MRWAYRQRVARLQTPVLGASVLPCDVVQCQMKRIPGLDSAFPDPPLAGRRTNAAQAGLKTRLYSVTAVCLMAASLGAVAQQDSTQLAAPRSGLAAVPLPPLDGFEPAVANQMQEQIASFRAVVGSGSLSNARLADAYGSLGRLFHAYELFESAEPGYLNAARMAPGDVTWPHLLGYLYQQTGRLEEAADRFREARRIRADDHAATIRLAEVSIGLNRLRDAREALQSVVDVFPALAQTGLGEVALRERRFEDAIRHFRAALERVPQASSIHYSLAMAYRGLGQVEEARSHLQQRGAAGIKVGDPIVDSLEPLVRGERGLVARGTRAYEAGHYQEAATAFARAIEAAPASATARVNLGLTQLQLGNTSEAVTQLRAAFELAPDDPDVSRELLRVLLRLGRDDDAIVVLRKSASAKPDDEETVVSLAILLAKKERFGEATALLGESHQKFPERIATATTLARLLASSPDGSIRNGQRALELATAVNDAEPSPVHGETIALALAELGRCDEALAWMKRAVEGAEQTQNIEEAARLRREMPKYALPSCRP
jgi:tetratricopeptide (TPR) repeat protein